MENELKADKARQLSLPSKHIFGILFPLPIMVGIGVWGSMSGWIGDANRQRRADYAIDLKIPEANVKELDKEKKYNPNLSGTDELKNVDGPGLGLDVGSYNSKMLSGQDPNSVGIEENSLEDVSELEKTFKSGENKDNEKQSPSARRQAIRTTNQRNQMAYNREVSGTLKNMYSDPDRRKYQSQSDIDPVEQARLAQSDRLLKILDRQMSSQNNQPSASQRKTPAIRNSAKNIDVPEEGSENVYSVEKYDRQIVRASSRGDRGNAFFGLNGGKSSQARPEKVKGAIRAVVHGEGDGILVKDGTSVFIRLLEKTSINVGGESLILPANTLVSGVARISGDRINITISTIRVDNFLYNVNLTAFDLDGRKGLYVPDMKIKNQINQSLAQSSGQALNPYYLMGGGSVRNQVGGQLAMQGINTLSNTARNIARRKMAEQKAHIKPNYQILLQSSTKAPAAEPDRGDEADESDIESGY
ncbi:Bacteroides conjugative transposon TraM protein [Dyadobacter sp. SG02]|uniref:conjugative transposon protein TraM n=1 Tax=Dyadobacter sp. SG02 TaxID=1855291 RepID=UPI0008B823DE|nr:conjugative transposon protein TraM [Dyadobacter sp. SG02]SEJ74486.1 Bacteroides conjugative transposon TraM protein [Dyadobacter sp. SG02]